MIFLKRLFLTVLALICCFSLAMAEPNGPLMETELSDWVDQMLRKSAPLKPLNDPVDESSKTEDGYAFLYDFATLYYDCAELNAQSILQSVSVTDASCPALRGVTIGADAETLIEAFGWRNPYLLGDGTFAAFYAENQLPRAAYWSWAQTDEAGNLTGVQCAMHVKAGEDQYTDAGVRFVLEGGQVTEIRVYGLYEFITLADVEANLAAVRSAENAIGHGALTEEGAEASDQPMFSLDDLAFDGLHFETLTIEQLEAKLGAKAQTQTMTDAGETLVTAEWGGVYMSGSENGWDVLSVSTDQLTGPRGLRVGQSLADAMGLFHADGENRELDGQILLYGDGVAAPYAVWDGSYVFYTAQHEDGSVTLSLQFSNGRLQEWMIYTW